MKRIILVALLLMIPFVALALDIDVDNNNATDVTFGGTNVTSYSDLVGILDSEDWNFSGTATFSGTVNLPAAISFPAQSIDADNLHSITSSPIIFAEPDQIQPISDAWPVMCFPDETYPGGVTITAIQVTTSETCADTLIFEEWAQGATIATSTVEVVTLSGTFTEDDGVLADASLARDACLYVDLPATPTDIAYYSVVVTFTAN